MNSKRFAAALKATGIHLLASAGIASFCAVFIFFAWYPPPFDQLSGGRFLVFLIIGIDAVCGPLLTFIVFNPNKQKKEMRRDLGFIIALQLIALSYGIYSAMQARPVWIAFESDRFRIVSVPDIAPEDLVYAPEALRNLSLTGPKMLGVRLASNSDPEFAKSILLSAEGFHPAFRPSRWIPYSHQLEKVLSEAKPLSNLYAKNSEEKNTIDKAVKKSGLDIKKLGYLPLSTEDFSDWAVIINLDTANPVTYLSLDAW